MIVVETYTFSRHFLRKEKSLLRKKYCQGLLLIIKSELPFENYNQVKATSTIMRFSIPKDYIL